jgi:hypothetical protein
MPDTSKGRRAYRDGPGKFLNGICIPKVCLSDAVPPMVRQLLATIRSRDLFKADYIEFSPTKPLPRATFPSVRT